MTEYEDATVRMPALSTDAAGPDPGAEAQPSMTDRASEAADQGKQALRDVAGSAADRARDVKDETARQARDLLSEARGHLERQASEQHRNVVTGLRSLGDELGSMHAEQPGLASELVSHARARVNDAADWFERREPGDLVGELRGFARRRPVTFLLGAAAAGIAVGRLTRGAVAAHSDDGGSGAAQLPAPADDSAGQGQDSVGAGLQRPTDDLYAVGATPTTPHNATTEVLPPDVGGGPDTPPGYGAPTYPPTGGGYGGPQ